MISPLQSTPLGTNRFSKPLIHSGEGEADINFFKVKNSFCTLLGISNYEARHVTNEIFKLQEDMDPNDARKTLLSKENTAPQLIITKNLIHILRERVGVGTFTEVYSADVIPTSCHQIGGEVRSPSKPFPSAVKRSKKPATFSPIKRKLDALMEPRSRGVDSYLATFKDSAGYGYSLNRLYSCDLAHADFHLLDQPVSAILNTLISASRGLAKIHDAGNVHRDVKGGNILVAIPSGEFSSSEDSVDTSSSASDEIEGALTDFDFLQEEKAEFHRTIGTPHYLDPSMFGDLEMCILNQKKRRGRQTKEGDVFALGITIYRDVLALFIHKISEKTPVHLDIHALMNRLKPKTEIGKFSDEDLKREGKESNYRVFHIFDQNGQDVLIRYPELDFLLETLVNACEKLQGILSQEEINVLIQLSHLSCRMQLADLSQRPTIDQALEEMSSMLDLCQVSSTSSTDSEETDSSSSECPAIKRAKVGHSS